MKKILATLLAVMMLTPAFAMADAAADTSTDAAADTEIVEVAQDEANTYHIVNNVQNMTVNMPTDGDSEYGWKFESSDESKLELVTCEDVEGQNIWAASFRRLDDATGDVTLTLTYAKGDEAPLYTVVMNINVDDAINIMSISNGTDTPWVESVMDDEVDVKLPSNPTTGYTWTYEASDPAMLDVTEDYVEDEHEEGMVGVGGTTTMKISPTMESMGDVEATFKYGQSGSESTDATRSVKLFVNEAGIVMITEATSELVENQAE